MVKQRESNDENRLSHSVVPLLEEFYSFITKMEKHHVVDGPDEALESGDGRPVTYDDVDPFGHEEGHQVRDLTSTDEILSWRD
jgi:hypothetical protein